MTLPPVGFWVWYAFAVVVCIAPACVSLRRRYHKRREEARLAVVCPPPVVRFAKADESLPQRAAVRRALAQEKRIEAARIESGRPVEERRIQLVVGKHR